MKAQKILLYAACVIIAVSAGLNIYLYKRLIETSENHESVSIVQENISDTRKYSEPAGDNTDASYVKNLEYQLDTLEEELEMVSNQLAEELDKNNSQKSPFLKPVFHKTLMNAIDRDYTLIYGPMDLSPQDLQKFKDIVAAWRIANGNRSALHMAASTPEEREAVEKYRQETREKYEKEFIDLMGEEKFKIYDDFKNSSSEDYMLSTYMKTLPSEDKIDNTDAYSLIDAMYRARKTIEAEMMTGNDNDNSSEKQKFDYLLSIEKKVTLYQKYEEVVDDALLLPAQAEQFKAYLRKERERYESQLKKYQDNINKMTVKQTNNRG